MKRLVLLLALVFAPAVAADAQPAATLKLVSDGKGAKQRLRFAPTKGAKYTIVSTSQESKTRGLKGKLGPAETTPLIRSTIEVEVTDVTKDGDLHYAFAYKKIEVVPDTRTKPEVVKAYETALAVAVAIKGTAVVTNRGLTKQVNFETPADASQELRNAVEMARSTMTQIALPLPEEEIGVGAQWQTTFGTTVGEITANTKVTYQLVLLANSKAKLKITTIVKGKGSGAGNLTTDTTGDGETEINLSSMIPTSSSAALRTEVGLDMDGKRLVQVGTTKVTMETK